MAAVIAMCRVANGFFRSVIRNVGVPSDSGRQPRMRVNALLRMAQDRHVDPHLTIGQLARTLGQSRTVISRTLATETGRSFQSTFRTHLNGVRLLAAIIKLQSSERISAIAPAVGYIDTKELDRQFHSWFGMSPSRFRMLIRGASDDSLQRCYD